MTGVEDLLGRKFGKLTVVDYGGYLIDSDGRKRSTVRCICDCGAEVIVRATRIRNGKTISCGCFQREKLRDRNLTHKSSGTRLYRIWCAMKTRCDNPNAYAYRNYGQRGIKICSNWANSFDEFQKWAYANGYNEDKSIDRIDNDGNYTPENCRWATTVEQANNKRNNRTLDYNGVIKTVSEWSKILGIPVYVIEDRVNKLCWDTVKALETPVKKGLNN